jgi:hypothetical protein
MWQDLVKWNAHRKYGAVRLAALLRNWTLLSHHGLTPALLNSPDPAQHIQPVFRLQVSWPCLPSPPLPLPSLLNNELAQGPLAAGMVQKSMSKLGPLVMAGAQATGGIPAITHLM